MVQLFGFRAYMFEGGLDRIRDSFRASITTMQNHSRDANDQLLDYILEGATAAFTRCARIYRLP